jgi:hypothetical protein
VKLKLSVSSIAALSVLLVFSCKKIDTTDIGDDLIPVVDNINTFDTVMDVITDNLLLLDSSRMLYTDKHGWGVIENDPEFGKTKAETYFSVTPATYGIHPFAKKDSGTVIFDSVVLALTYSSGYGDTATSIQKMDVFEILSDGKFGDNANGFRIDTAEIGTLPTLLGSKTVNFAQLDDSVYDKRKRDTLRLKNQLRIQLDKTLGNRFLAYDTSNAYRNDSIFRDFFAGLALHVDEGASPVKKAIAYFDIPNANTKLIFYYRVQSGATIIDTLATEFGFQFFNRANANRVSRVPGNSYLAYLNNASTNDDKIYLQTSPGSFATVKIPNLKTLSNRVVHRAELIFEIIPSLDQNIFGRPNSLFMDVEDTARKRIMTVPYSFDFNTSFQVLFGGFEKNNRYVFNLARYVQGIVTRGEPDYTLRLYAPFETSPTDFFTGLTPNALPINAPIAAGRVVLTGGSFADATKRARLRIIYSKI